VVELHAHLVLEQRKDFIADGHVALLLERQDDLLELDALHADIDVAEVVADSGAVGVSAPLHD